MRPSATAGLCEISRAKSALELMDEDAVFVVATTRIFDEKHCKNQ